MTVHNSWSLDALVEAYSDHQQRTRGMRTATLRNYIRFARLFIRATLGDEPIVPGCIGASDVMAFVTAIQSRFSPSSMKTVRTALRSFLRFLHVKGLLEKRLEAAFPRVAHWRLSTLPRCLSEQQLRQVLASFDDSTPCGCRDRAIVLCLATLGLRPGEVADLHLEDIDWRDGTIRLRTRKTRRGAILPLPREAGQAIAAYLRKERPTTVERRVFVQHLGRRCGELISSNAVSAAAVRALRRAQVETPLSGAYVFRHTAASRLVQRGASLKEVADFLGHRSLDSTTIYTKLDLPALREVALPWPELDR